MLLGSQESRVLAIQEAGSPSVKLTSSIYKSTSSKHISMNFRIVNNLSDLQLHTDVLAPQLRFFLYKCAHQADAFLIL